MTDADAPPPPPPAAALTRLLPPDVDLAAGWRHPAARPVWYGVVWGRLGRGDRAFAHLDRVRLPALGPWIAAERGRILRELGLHAAAESVEFPALAEADDPVDAVMLRLSLVADAVGQGDAARAARRLAGAREALAQLPDSPRAARQRLRATWVEVEVAALTGRSLPVEVTARLPRWDTSAGRPAEVPDLRAGSAFHRAKAWLFSGIVHDDDRLLAAAREVAPPCLAWAIALARADRGAVGADREARDAWAAIVPPPGYGDQVAATAVGRRLRPAHPRR